MRTFCLIAICTLLIHPKVNAQWIAPEGRIINYRTLVWGDFAGKPQKEELQAGVVATTQPAIYAQVEGAEELPNGKFKVKFKVKCAFQTASWRREDLAGMPSDHVLQHECDHYDIALTFANKLQYDLSTKEYDEKTYRKEIHDTYQNLMNRYEDVQDKYDEAAGHGVQKENQYLWDLRVKKCLENTSDAFYETPLATIQNVLNPGQTVKRLPEEPTRLFAVRCRPFHSEFTDDLAPKIFETKEWTGENSAMIAFYAQAFKNEKEYEATTEGTRLLAYAFMPMGNREYKRVLIDTFCFDGKAPKPYAVFFANADTTDKTKELIITVALDQKDGAKKGVSYYSRAYDNTGIKTFPNRLRKFMLLNSQLEGGFEGIENGKPAKARLKTEADIVAELTKLGYAQ